MTLAKLVEQLKPILEKGLDDDARSYFYMDKALKERIKAAIRTPSGMAINHLDARPPLAHGESHLTFSLDIDGPLPSSLDFARVYSRVHELNLPELSYTADVAYEPAAFATDDMLDLRVFERMSVEKKGRRFSMEPYLRRTETEENIYFHYSNYKASSQISYGAGIPREKIWLPAARDIAGRFDLDIDLRMTKEDYSSLLKGGFIERIKKRSALRSVLRKEQETEFGKALFGMFGLEHQPKMEGTISYRRLRELEQLLDVDLSPHVHNVLLHIEAGEERRLGDALKGIAGYLADAQVPGTAPGDIRISRAQAEEFLRKDLHDLGVIAKGINIAERRYDNDQLTSLPREFYSTLLERSGRLTGMKLEEHFAMQPSIKAMAAQAVRGAGMQPKALSIEEAAARLLPKDCGAFAREMEAGGVPTETREAAMKDMASRKDDFHKDGYLIILDLYAIAISALERKAHAAPEELLQRYIELYRDEPAGQLDIKGEMKGRRPLDGEDRRHWPEAARPVQLANRATATAYEIYASTRGFDDNKIRYRDGSFSFTILLEKPALLPVQQHVMDVLGASVDDLE